MRKRIERSAIGNICLIFVSLLCVLGLAELSLRFVGYDGAGYLKNGRERILRPSPHPDIKYDLRPNVHSRAWGTNVDINAQGYRGRMPDPAFQGFRIIVLGDSITFGNFLDLESTYAYQLSDILNTCGMACEVLNFGIGGYDTLQEVALLEHRGLAYKPDLVVVGFCLNDIGVVSPNYEYIDKVERYRSNLIFYSRLVQFIDDRLARAQVGSWLQEKNRAEVFKKDFAGRIAEIHDSENRLLDLMDRIPDQYPSNWYKSRLRVGRLRYAFERLSQLSKKENFTVVVLTIPRLIEVSGVYPHRTAHQIVALEAQRVGFDVVEIVDEFMNAGMDNLKISKKDPTHPNETGHRIMAQNLAGYIRENDQGKGQ